MVRILVPCLLVLASLSVLPSAQAADECVGVDRNGSPLVTACYASDACLNAYVGTSQVVREARGCDDVVPTFGPCYTVDYGSGDNGVCLTANCVGTVQDGGDPEYACWA